MMTPEEVAEHFAFERPGYVLADYGLVGLPYWRTRIRASIQARKPIGPIHEFVLRTCAAGISEQAEIGHLLGLDPSTVLSTVADLIGSGFMRLGESESVSLTDEGSESLELLQEIVVEECEVTVFYDGLLRIPVDYIGDWAEPRQLVEHGVHEIPASPSRGPTVDEVRNQLPQIEKLISRALRGREELADILAIKAVDRRERVFKEAVALVYRAQRGTDCQIAFAVDGEISEPHENAFAAAGLMKKLGIGKEGIVPARRLAEQELPASVIDKLDEDQANVLQSELHFAQTESKDEKSAVSVETARAALDALEVRPVATYDHPRLLREALDHARKRVLILSPWIRGGVVNQDFCRRLERCLDRGVDVHIGWGISRDDSDEPDAHPHALERLERLAGSYPNLVLRRLGDTHAKVLICDEHTLVVTSFNWLSFRGDPKRTFRDEQGTLVSIPTYVDEEYNKFRLRFEVAE